MERMDRETPARLAALVLCALCSSLVIAAETDAAATERFLASAKLIKSRPIGVGVTHSERVTLKEGSRTADAMWKIIDERVPFKKFDDGTFEMSFSDSWQYEVAAYELDKLLGLDMVPVTVERRLKRKRGALQIWMVDTMTELDRTKRKILVRDIEGWNRQMYKVRLFHNLTYNTDFNNLGNILSDSDQRIHLIDHSRAFRTRKELLAEEDLTRFSAETVESLRTLDQKSLKAALGKWLSKAQIEALLVRRDLVLARVDQLVAEKGSEAVLFP